MELPLMEQGAPSTVLKEGQVGYPLCCLMATVASTGVCGPLHGGI